MNHTGISLLIIANRTHLKCFYFIPPAQGAENTNIHTTIDIKAKNPGFL